MGPLAPAKADGRPPATFPVTLPLRSTQHTVVTSLAGHPVPWAAADDGLTVDLAGVVAAGPPGFAAVAVLGAVAAPSTATAR